MPVNCRLILISGLNLKDVRRTCYLRRYSMNVWCYGFFQGTYNSLLDTRIHNSGVIMGTIASQITSLMIVYSTVYSDADQRKHQSSASLTFVRGIHRWPVNSPHKWPVTGKCFHLMTSSCLDLFSHYRIRNQDMSRISLLMFNNLLIPRYEYNGSHNPENGAIFQHQGTGITH